VILVLEILGVLLASALLTYCGVPYLGLFFAVVWAGGKVLDWWVNRLLDRLEIP